jgi:hypothetical protein
MQERSAVHGPGHPPVTMNILFAKPMRPSIGGGGGLDEPQQFSYPERDDSGLPSNAMEENIQNSCIVP